MYLLKRNEVYRTNELELATIKRRFSAFLLDCIFIIILYFIVLAIFSLFNINDWKISVKSIFEVEIETNMKSPLFIILLKILFGFLPVLYFTVLLYFLKGRTIGKFLLRIKVVSLYHKHLGLWHCFERSLGYFTSALEFGFGFIQAIWNPNRMALHDKIAESVVINMAKKKPVLRKKLKVVNSSNMKTKNILLAILLISSFSLYAQVKTEKWKVFELTLAGPKEGNPFKEVKLSGQFIKDNDTITVPGFYDGERKYKIRFMPQKEGPWNYVTTSNVKELNKKKGSFICTPPQKDNHGPVSVKDTFYFAYADGTPHYSFGTTCYGWVHQGDSLAEETIKTLSKGYFNKIRMCIFPKSYDWNNNEPEFYPFEGTPLKNWNFTRLNPAFFRNIEKRIRQLDSLGIQADLIVFHPYDRWGFSALDRTTEDMYIDYVIARFSAYKNVWWSMANEWDFMKDKKLSDWDYYIEQFAAKDKYHHLIGIHNGTQFYDHTNPLITHASIQSEETYRAKEYRRKYKKPVVFDECRYEGNIPWSWGNLTARSLTEKFWRGFTNGGYVGHGETYVTEKPVKLPQKSSDILWWSKGGDLKGESPDRIKFLRKIIESAPLYMKPIPLFTWMPFSAIGIEKEYYLGYFNDAQPGSAVITLPGDSSYKVEIIDTWNMTITPVEKSFSGYSLIELPSKPYIAIRITRQK